MNGKKAGYIFAAVMMAVLCISIYISLKNNNTSDETIVIINSSIPVTSSDASQEETQQSVKITEKATENAKTTKVKSTSAKSSTEKKTSTVKQQTAEESEIQDEIVWIDINSADAEELMLLKGVGEEIAANIIAYREENGGFRNIEEIMNVSGIGEKKFEDICEYIYVENPSYDDEEEAEFVPEPEEIPDEEEITEAAEEIPAEQADDSVQDEMNADDEAEEATYETETEHVLTLEEVAPIDINTADKELLLLLPYVTDDIANKIIEMREELNGFKNTYELLLVEELEQKQVAEILEFVTVGQ
jgi:comEA protein